MRAAPGLCYKRMYFLKSIGAAPALRRKRDNMHSPSLRTLSLCVSTAATVLSASPIRSQNLTLEG